MTGALKDLKHIPLSYNNADSRSSALRLILAIFPQWEREEGQIDFIRFKDGITNTVCPTLPFAHLPPPGLHECSNATSLATQSCEEETWSYRRAIGSRSSTAESIRQRY